MTPTETGKIMDILKTAYPRFYSGPEAPDIRKMVGLWSEMFRDDDVALVAAAVKALILADDKGYPPHIGAVKAKLRMITGGDAMTEGEAWGLVAKAIRNSGYGSREEFEKLPPIVRRIVGSPSQLREWSQMDIETVHSVVASNFQRSYKVIAQREREIAKLPPDVRCLMASVAGGLEEKPEAKSLPKRDPSEGKEGPPIPPPREILKAAISLKTGRSRDDGTTVDNLEIEVEASSAEAEKKVDALCQALERLKKATGGFGNVSDRIRGIGDAAGQSTATAKTQQKRAALERAVGAGNELDADTSRLQEMETQYQKLGEAFDSALDKYERLNAEAKEIHKTRFLDESELRNIEAAEKAVDDLSNRYHALGKEIEAAKKSRASGGSGDEPEKNLSVWERLKGKISETTSTAEGLKKILSSDLSLQNLIPKGVETAFQGLTDKALGFVAAHPAVAAALIGVSIAVKTLWNGMKEIGSTFFSALKKGFEMVAAAAKKLGAALKNLAKDGISKAVSGLKSLAVSFGRKLTSPIRGAINAYNKWKDALLRVAFYRAGTDVRGGTERAIQLHLRLRHDAELEEDRPEYLSGH